MTQFTSVRPKYMKNGTEPYINYNKAGNSISVTTDHVASGFALGQYVYPPDYFDTTSASNFEIQVAMKTGGSVSTYQSIISGNTRQTSNIVLQVRDKKFKLYVAKTAGSNSFNVSRAGSYILQVNTNYLVRIKFTGTLYTVEYSTNNGSTWVTDISVSSTSKPYTDRLRFGTASSYYTSEPQAFLGSIDLKNCYIKINNVTWWSGIAYRYKPVNGTLEDYDFIQNSNFMRVIPKYMRIVNSVYVECTEEEYNSALISERRIENSYYTLEH